MSNQESVTCPVNDKPCEFYHYCAGKKELEADGGINPASSAGIAIGSLPEAIRDVMSGSYCRDLTIAGLAKVATGITHSRITRELAAQRALAVINASLLFAGTQEAPLA